MAYIAIPNRRQFLAHATLGTVSLHGASKTVRWAFLSDTHISEDTENEYRGFRPYDNLNQVVPQVLRAAPEGVVIDGDLARMEGLPGDYRQLKHLLEPLSQDGPIVTALGNHDHRENFLNMFRDDPGERQYVQGKYVLAIDTGPVRLLTLDSLMEANVTPGFLGKKQRTWLDVYLKAAPPKPTIIFVHHTLDDGDTSLLDVLWLFRILKPHRMVKAVVYGHSHVYKFQQEDGIHLVNLPAVGYNFGDQQPVGWVEAMLSAEGADFKLHAIGGNVSGDGDVKTVRWRS